jgi:hypothetical protein
MTFRKIFDKQSTAVPVKVQQKARLLYQRIKPTNMKKINFVILLMLSVTLFSGCSKSNEEEEGCEDTNTTKVTYRNTTNAALRVVVSMTLTPQFEPVSPIFTIDLAPGQSVPKEFTAGRYINSWYSNCATSCNRIGNIFKDYASCSAYEESR